MKILILTRQAKESDFLGKAHGSFYLYAIQAHSWLSNRGHSVSITRDHELINMHEYDLAISYYYDKILRPDEFEAPRFDTINSHPSYLPYGRGATPNVWAIVNQEPAGVTIHWIDEGVDTGNILAQEEVPVTIWDTGETLYHRLESTCYELLCAYWPELERLLECDYRPLGKKQPDLGIPTRKSADLKFIERLNLSSWRLVYDLLRARTFPPYRGCYIELREGVRAYLSLNIEVVKNGD